MVSTACRELSLSPCRGTYLLRFHLPAMRCRVGALGDCALPAGDYAYVGSAFGAGGVSARVRHHLVSRARPHWHLDYLRAAMRMRAVWYTCDPRRREALWSRVLAHWPGSRQPLPGFGAADCRRRGAVQSHLFLLTQDLDAAAFRAALLRRAPRHADIVCRAVETAEITGASSKRETGR